MIDVTKEVKEAYLTDNIEKQIQISFPNGEHEPIGNSSIMANTFSYVESLCSQDELKFGLCESNVLNVTVECEDNIKGCEIVVDMTILYDGKQSTLNLGKFTIDSCRRVAGTKLRSIVAYTMDFYKGLNYPKEILEKLDAVYTTQESEKVLLNTLLLLSNDNVDINGEGLSHYTTMFGNVISHQNTFDTCTNNAIATQYRGRLIKSYKVRVQKATTGMANREGVSRFENYTDFSNHYYTDKYGLYSYHDAPEIVADLFLGKNRQVPNYYVWSASQGKVIALPEADRKYFETLVYNPFVIGDREYYWNNYIKYEYDHQKYLPVDDTEYVYSIEVEFQDSYASGSATFHNVIYPVADVGQFEFISSTDKKEYLYLNKAETEEGSGKYVIVNAPTISDIIEGYYESKGRFVYTKRDGTISIKTINDNFALYPEDIIYPNEELYPVKGSNNYQPLVATSYKAANYEEFNTQKYGYVRVKYMASDNEPYSITVSCNPRYKNVYDMTNNAFFLQGGTIWDAESVSQYIKDNFYPNIKDITYNPADVKIKGLPFLEAGDVIKVYADLGAFKTFVFRRTMTGEQSLTDQVEAKGSEETPNSSAWRAVVGVAEGE